LLPHRIRGALVPLRIFQGLFGGQNLDPTLGELVVAKMCRWSEADLNCVRISILSMPE